MRPQLSLLAAALLVVASALAGARPARAVLPADQVYVVVTGSPLSSITTSPSGLTPVFSQATHDYVTRCQSGVNNITLTLSAAGGTIQAGGQSGSTVSVLVSLGESQAAVVRATDPGNPSGPPTEYWIRCLPHDFPQLTISRSGNPTMPGWYLTGNASSSGDGSSYTYAMILDGNGTPVWYQAAQGGAIDVTLLPNDVLAWAPNLGPGVGADPTRGFNLYQLDIQGAGTLKAPIPPTDPHELLRLADGEQALIASPIRSGVDLSFNPGLSAANGNIVDCLIEVVGSAGNLAWQWRASDHIAATETTSPALISVNGQTVADIYHCNSVDADPAAPPASANLLLSVRHASAVYLINRASGSVIWKMGGSTVTPDGGAAPRLAVTGDPETTFDRQHDARFQPSNHVSLYDNHSNLPGAARGVEYAIDTVAHTATHVWSYAAPDGRAALATGNFRRYANGTDNLIGWGIKNGSGFTEVDGAGTVQFSMSYPNGEIEYRVVKVPAAALDVNTLRATAGLPRPLTSTVSWEQLGGALTSKPAAASQALDRLDAFVRGTDQQMWHKSWNGSQWSPWEPLGGVLASGPGAAAWGSGRLDVFVEGSDRQMWHKWWDSGSWSAWEPLGGVLASAPAVVSWAAGRLDVFVQGTDQQVWHKWWDGSRWNGWEPLGGQSTADPGAASRGAGRLDLLVRNPDGSLGHRSFDAGAWSSWESVPASLTSGPSATSSGPDKLDVVAAGASGVPQRLLYSGGWQNWQSLGGATPQTPSVVTRQAGAEDVFVTGTDGFLYHAPLVGPLAAGVNRPRPPTPQEAAAGV